MKYERFEDTPVWKAAMRLGDRVAQLLEHRYFRRRRGLADQLDRAVVSVSNNIAEGFERGTTAALIAFIGYAKGSVGEVRSMLHGLVKRASAPESMIQDSKSEIQAMVRESESISRQLQGWLEYLLNTDLKGPRHLTDQMREEEERKRSREAFLAQLKAMAPKFPDVPAEESAAAAPGTGAGQ